MMKTLLLFFGIFILLTSCKKESKEDLSQENYFVYENTKRFTPTASYKVYSSGVGIALSSFTYDPKTATSLGTSSGNGLSFDQLKVSDTNHVPVGIFQSFVNWGDTNSTNNGMALLDVISLHPSQLHMEYITSGTISITATSEGYLINYTAILTNNDTIKGHYQGPVFKQIINQ